MITKEKLELVAELVFNGIPYLKDTVGVNEFFPGELREAFDFEREPFLDNPEAEKDDPFFNRKIREFSEEDYPSEEEIETILSLFVTLGLFVREDDGEYTATGIAEVVRSFYIGGFEGVGKYLENL